VPIVKFTQQTMPQSSIELKQALQNALENSSPLDDFVQVIKDLRQFELEYKLESDEFFSRFQRGEMGDDIDFIRWANKYEIYQEIKIELEHIFDLLAQYALPVTA
jgi:hypothetical protein